MASMSITKLLDSLIKSLVNPRCYPNISSSILPFSSCLQFFQAPGVFPMSHFFASVSQSIRTSASASVLPLNIQDWFPFRWTTWISLLSKGVSRVFSKELALHIRWLSTGASASASVLPLNIQDWFPLRLPGLIFLLPKGLSRVFFNITVQKHQFFGNQLSLWSNSHIHTWLLE